jgi:hypothetical protein
MFYVTPYDPLTALLNKPQINIDVPVHVMKAYRGVEIELHPFLTSA